MSIIKQKNMVKGFQITRFSEISNLDQQLKRKDLSITRLSEIANQQRQLIKAYMKDLVNTLNITNDENFKWQYKMSNRIKTGLIKLRESIDKIGKTIYVGLKMGEFKGYLNVIYNEISYKIHNFFLSRKGLKCYYCNRNVKLKELLYVDNELNNMHIDVYEELMYELDDPEKPKQDPYVHMSDLGYEVLNMCKVHIEWYKEIEESE